MQTRAHNCRAVTYRDTAVQVPGKWTRHRLMYCVRLRRWARHQQPAKYPCAAMTQQPASTYTLRRADCSTLPKIDDDISSLESINLEVPRLSKPPEPIVLKPSRLLEPENRPLKPVFKSFEEPIKPMDPSN